METNSIQLMTLKVTTTKYQFYRFEHSWHTNFFRHTYQSAWFKSLPQLLHSTDFSHFYYLFMSKAVLHGPLWYLSLSICSLEELLSMKLSAEKQWQTHFRLPFQKAACTIPGAIFSPSKIRLSAILAAVIWIPHRHGIAPLSSNIQ